MKLIIFLYSSIHSILSFILIFTIRKISKKFLLDDLEFIAKKIEKIQFDLEQGKLAIPSLCAQQMLISAEDHRASKHCGVDIFAICRAIFVGVIYGKRQGASTIEQQVIRIISNRYEITLSRKIKEILLAILLTEKIEKHIFPSIYLTIGYYGTNILGYENVCKVLGYEVDDENPIAAAKIVSRLKYPQPKIDSYEKNLKIKKREVYLIKLYQKHIEKGFYDYLRTWTVLSCKHRFTKISSSS